MRHGSSRATSRLRRLLRAAAFVAWLPVLARVYAGVLAGRLRSAGPGRALVGLVAVAVLTTAVAPALAGFGRPAGAPGTFPAPATPGSTAGRAVSTPGPTGSPAALVGAAESGPEADTPDGAAAPAGELAAPAAPAVVRFRPLDGTAGVSRRAEVSVRFTLAMDHASTEAAFVASIDGTSLTGTYRWAEGDTVLVFRPSRAFPYGAHVALAVDGSARSADGVRPAPAAAAFTVQPAPTVAPTVASSAWRWPLLGPITQYFGQSLTRYGYHEGIDIDGETGDPVRAARTGRVVVAGHYDSCGGLEVHIDHGDGLVSWYRHLSRIDIAVGDWVTAGTVIGLVGDTGCSLGSHLHFAIRRGATFVNPLAYLPAR